MVKRQSIVAVTFCLCLATATLHGQDTPASLADALRSLAARVAALAKPDEPSTGITEPAQLQAAIDAATTCTTLYLRPGAVYGVTRVRRCVRLTTHGSGTQASSARVTAADAAGFAIFEPTGNLPAFDITASDVTIDSVAIRGNVDTHIQCGSSSATTVEQQPINVTLSRLYMDGSAGAKRGIGLHCRNATVEHSHIAGYRRVGQDTQAIGGWNGPGPYVIRNNYLEGAGENVMFGGAAPAIPGMVPRDILLEANTFSKDPAWKAAGYTVKNLLEFKVGERVMVRGNHFENVWQGGQSGYAIMITPQAQDSPNPNYLVASVTIERNTFVNVGSGMTIAGRQQLGAPCLQGSGFVIRQNWMRITRTFNGGSAQGWPVFLTGEPRDVVIEQNTIETDGNQILFQQGPPILGLRVVGNLFPRSGIYGFSGWANGTTQHRGAFLSVYAPGAVVSGNAFGSFPTVANLPGNLHAPTSAITVQDGYGTGEFAIYGRTVQ